MANVNALPEYKRKKWDMSKYRPQAMTLNAMDLSQEIRLTCNHLKDLQIIINKLSREIQSAEFHVAARKMERSIDQMNTLMSNNCMNLVTDLTTICEAISKRNNQLAENMIGSKEILNSCKLELENIER